MEHSRRTFLQATGAVLATAPFDNVVAADAGTRRIKLREGYEVWTQRLGSGPTKVLLLHGGPGIPHDYLQCFADFLPQAGIEIYFYDQLGVGLSDHPDDTSLWTIERYLGEVEQVRAALGLERFVLYGHSWGGVLTMEYALSRHAKHLKAAVVSNMTASMEDYTHYTRSLKNELPVAVRKELADLEAAGQGSGARYSEIVFNELYPRHVCRVWPFPGPVQRAFDNLNPKIYNHMQGANEFEVTGNLQGWDRWKDLHRIDVPTLWMGARHDEMNPKSISREASLVRNAKLFVSESGSHLTMWDDQTNYFRALLRFLAALPPA
jgi:proline iminopeptidase